MASLADYLKRYTSDGSSKGLDKKKKKKKRKEGQSEARHVVSGLQIVDDDVKWQKDIKEESDDEEVDDNPQVEEDVEVKRMQKMEQAKAHRPYLTLGQDGSGWVSVKEEKLNNTDLSPPRRGGGSPSNRTPPRRQRHDSPEPRELHETKSYPDSHNSPDISPPRKSRHDSPDLPPPRKSQNDSNNFSPPRRQRHDSPETFPQRKVSPNLSPSDLSPPRRKQDLSPPRRNRDRSPPHKKQDLSPPRRNRDLSPPRRNQDLSPPRRNQDLSPPRRNQDLSPPRRNRDLSPPLSPPRRIHPSEKKSLDLSPPRRRNQNSSEAYPPQKRSRLSPDSPGQRIERREREGEDGNPITSLRNKNKSDRDLSPPRKRFSSAQDSNKLQKDVLINGPQKMTDGTIAGLRTGKEVSAELEQKRRDDIVRFKQLDASVTGRGAETVYRDKQGKKSNLEQIMEESKASKKRELPPPVWGKGLAQQRAAQIEASEMAAAADRPFALQRDVDLDTQLRERIRWGDPMAHLVKQREPEFILPDLGDNEAMRESGFKIPQEVPPHSWLKRRINPPPNRYDIRPGRHWDGVDRSTGFEREMFKHKNESKAQETEAYLWSVSDM